MSTIDFKKQWSVWAFNVYRNFGDYGQMKIINSDIDLNSKLMVRMSFNL